MTAAYVASLCGLAAVGDGLGSYEPSWQLLVLAAVLISVAFGALVDRFWAVGIPPALLSVLLVLALAASGSDGETVGEPAPFALAVVLTGLANLVTTVPILIGVLGAKLSTPKSP